jgi:transposase
VQSLEEIITTSKEVREVKRALCVKMVLEGIGPAQISEVLPVSVPYVSQWKGLYEAEGVAGLALGYQGSRGYLTEAEREAVMAWINGQETLSVESLGDYVEVIYHVIYQSKQSYYDLLEAGGMSYHKSEKANPKRDEAQVQTRRDEIKKTGTVLGCHPTG